MDRRRTDVWTFLNEKRALNSKERLKSEPLLIIKKKERRTMELDEEERETECEKDYD